ncbi:MAG: hypothetical protein ACRCT1_08370 [Microcoleaceae cyanobacterium]
MSPESIPPNPNIIFLLYLRVGMIQLFSVTTYATTEENPVSAVKMIEK